MVKQVNQAVDRKLLFGFFGLIIAVMVVFAVWTTFFIAASNPGLASLVALIGLVYGTWVGRLRKVPSWVRAALLLVVLIVLLVFVSVASHDGAYQFTWLFSTLIGMLLARQERPWWSEERTT